MNIPAITPPADPAPIARCDHPAATPTVSYPGLVLYHCPQCKLVFSEAVRWPLDPRDLYKDFYQNELSGRFRFGIETVIRLFRFFRAYKMHTIAPSARSIIDIGSGRGFMLYFLKRYYGYTRAVGTQIAENMYRFSRDVLRLEVYHDDLLELDLEPQSFDIVSIWHVLEHVKDPQAYLAAFRDLLADGGTLVIETPNYNSWSRRLTGRYWLGLDPKYHLHHFTPESLSLLVRRYGFEIRQVHTFSLEYSTFISAQSMVSLLTGSDQQLFAWLQDGGFSAALIAHMALMAVLVPISLVINLALYFTRRGEVLLIIARKRPAGKPQAV